MYVLGPKTDRKGSGTSEPKVFYGTWRDPQLRFTFVFDAVDYYWRVAIGRRASLGQPSRELVSCVPGW